MSKKANIVPIHKNENRQNTKLLSNITVANFNKDVETVVASMTLRITSLGQLFDEGNATKRTRLEL